MRSYALIKFPVFLFFALFMTVSWADEYDDAIKTFKTAGQSGEFFDNSYGYAVFPTIGKGGIGIGGAHGSGRVYARGKLVGYTKMTQLTVGLQLGAQAFSEIIFFEDKRAFDKFTSGNFGFSAQASAVALTAATSVGASTEGSSTSASGGKNNAITAGKYRKGMAVFTIAKGGLMYEAAVGGQKFSYKTK